MTLPRVLEPEVMDSYEEARDYDAMDHSVVNAAFVADLLATGPIAGELLDVGTGTARIPCELCARAPECRVVASDLSTFMLDQARYTLVLFDQTERIRLDHVDAKRMPYDEASFDLVFSNSILHHIPEPAVVLRESLRVLKAGERIFFRDLVRPDDRATLDDLVATYAAGESDHARQMFRDSLHAALTLAEIRALVGQLGFSQETVQQTSDRHWTWSARKPA